jgi:hypothetical protein
LLTITLLPFLKTGTTAVSFHKDGNVSLDTLRLNMYASNGIKISEQPIMINDGISSKPTQLEGFRRFIALLTSAAETGAIGKKSVVRDCGAVMVGQDVLKIDLK